MPIRRFRFVYWTAIGVAALAVLVTMASWFNATTQGRAFQQTSVEAARRAGGQARSLRSDLQKFRLLPLVLSEFPDVGEAIATESPAARSRLNLKLGLLARRTGVPYIYAVDRDGLTVAASNADLPTSFVGRSYRFRPYFTAAMRDGSTEYFALGNVTGKVGLFLSRRIEWRGQYVGAIIVKVEFDAAAASWHDQGNQTLVVDSEGVILISSDPALRFRTIGQPSAQRLEEIARTQQFGDVTIAPSGLTITRDGRGTDAAGNAIVAASEALPIQHWRLLHIEPIAPALRQARARILVIGLSVLTAILILAMAIGWPILLARRAVAARSVLEHEVARRTQELSASNDRLLQEADERFRLDQRFRAAREELAQANRLGSLGAITAGIAHEINQPIASIRTLAANSGKLLQRGATDRVAAHLDTISGLTERISQIIAEMRGYARRRQRAPDAISVEDAIEGTMLLIGERFRRAQVALDRPAPQSAVPLVRADRVRLEQVLVNLLQNALDALIDTADPRIAILFSVHPDTLDIVVADNGPGIPPEIVGEIFEPFTTGKPDGLGLGLGIARDIVIDFGGTLTLADSALGGSAFRITLRRAGVVEDK